MIKYSVGGAAKMLAEIHELAKLALPPSAAAVTKCGCARSPLPDGAAIKAMLAQRPTTKQIEAYLRLVTTKESKRND